MMRYIASLLNTALKNFVFPIIHCLLLAHLQMQYANNIVNDNFDDSATCVTLGVIPHHVDIELDTLLALLRQTQNPTGQSINNMVIEIILNECKQLFTQIQEHTASSPPKLHMVHYIASYDHKK